jgi:DNA-binding transcriptional LysR family regulator
MVHRLARFTAAHPGIDPRVSATLHNVAFAREDIDVAVRHGDGNWPGLEATRLCAEQIFAICSPKLLAGGKSPAVACRRIEMATPAARGSEQGLGAMVRSCRGGTG